jgi:hypothetical protein
MRRVYLDTCPGRANLPVRRSPVRSYSPRFAMRPSKPAGLPYRFGGGVKMHTMHLADKNRACIREGLL